MPINNLINLHLTAAEIATINTALNTIETTLAPKCKNLTPEERLSLGSIKENNKLLVNKVRDFRNTQPNLSSPDIDWTEYEADWQDRYQMETLLMRLSTLSEMLSDTKILHDHDNYQQALLEYKYTKYKADTEAAGGYSTKHEELKQFFPNTGGGSGSSTDPTT